MMFEVSDRTAKTVRVRCDTDFQAAVRGGVKLGLRCQVRNGRRGFIWGKVVDKPTMARRAIGEERETINRSAEMSVEVLLPASIFQVSGLWYGSNPPGSPAAVAMIDEGVASYDGEYVYSMGSGSRLNVFFSDPILAGPFNRIRLRFAVKRDPTSSGNQVEITPTMGSALTPQTLNMGSDWNIAELIWEGSWSAVELTSLYCQIYQAGGNFINLSAVEAVVGMNEPSYEAHPRPWRAEPQYSVATLRSWY